MALDTIKQTWDSEFKGIMETPTGTINIGDEENGMAPYHMLFGALGACFYATFLSIAKKKRLTFDKATLEVSGKKEEKEREPRLLEEAVMTLTITNPSNEKGFIRSAELGAEYCSIHKTLEKIAHIELKVEFN